MDSDFGDDRLLLPRNPKLPYLDRPNLYSFGAYEMESIGNEMIPALEFLLPGFLSTLVFYWLAEIPKPSQSERIIQALVSTTLIQMIIPFIKVTALHLGSFYAIGTWTTSSPKTASLLLAVLLGLALALLSNHDIIYSVARKLRLTTKASQDDYILALQRLGDSGVILHLNDGKRVLGHIASYPNNRETGVFHILKPRWMVGNIALDNDSTSSMIINGLDVRFIEFLPEEK